MPSTRRKTRELKRSGTSCAVEDAERTPKGRKASATSVEDPMLTTPTPASPLCNPPRSTPKTRSVDGKSGKTRRVQESVEQASGLRRSRRAFSRLANLRMQGQAEPVDLFAPREKLVEVVKEVLDMTDAKDWWEFPDVPSSDRFVGISVKEEDVEDDKSDAVAEGKASVQSSDSEGLPDVDEPREAVEDRVVPVSKVGAPKNRTKTSKNGRRNGCSESNTSKKANKNDGKAAAVGGAPRLTPVREQDAAKAVEELGGFLESVDYFGADWQDTPMNFGVGSGKTAGENDGRTTTDALGKSGNKALPSKSNPRKRKKQCEGLLADMAPQDGVEPMLADCSEPVSLPSLPAECPKTQRLKSPSPESTKCTTVSSETSPVDKGGRSKKRLKVQGTQTNVDRAAEAGQQAQNGFLNEPPSRTPEISTEAVKRYRSSLTKGPLNGPGSIPAKMFPIFPPQRVVSTYPLERHVHHPAFILPCEMLVIGLPLPEVAGLNPVRERMPGMAGPCGTEGEILEFSELMRRFAPRSAGVDRASRPPGEEPAGDAVDSSSSPVRSLVDNGCATKHRTASILGKDAHEAEPASSGSSDKFPGFDTPTLVQRMELNGIAVGDSQRGDTIGGSPLLNRRPTRLCQLKEDGDCAHGGKGKSEFGGGGGGAEEHGQNLLKKDCLPVHRATIDTIRYESRGRLKAAQELKQLKAKRRPQIDVATQRRLSSVRLPGSGAS